MRGSRHEGDFAHSLADLMSGVAVMFLVIAAIFMVQASQAKKKALLAAQQDKLYAAKFKELDQRDQQGIQDIEALRDSLQTNKNIELIYDKKKDPRLLTIVFSRDNLRFGSGECAVDDATHATLQQTLRDIFPRICATVGTGLEKTITLEGHTDNEPPMGVRCEGIASANACYHSKTDGLCKRQSFESNVKLSAARAQYVFFAARDALKDQPGVAECLDHNFMVAGRGPMEPLDGGSWDKPRSGAENEKNRRVVIKVRVTVAGVEQAAQ